MNMKKFLNICLTAAVLLSLSCGDIFGRTRYVIVGTGESSGIYYATGGLLSKVLSKNRKKHGIGLSVEATEGSVYNINAVLKGKLDFGIAQSDCQYKAYHATGGSAWDGGAPKTKLRSLFALHTESVTLIAPIITDIATVRDLKGLKVNLGGAGSGPLQNAKDVLVAFGLGEHMLDARYLQMSKAVKFAREGGISAFFYTTGHPSKLIKTISEMEYKSRLIEISGPSIVGMLRNYPYYSKTIIATSFYPGFANKTNVPTIGVKAVFFTSKDIDADLVYALTREVFENLEYFKTLHEVYGSLTRKNMLEGVSAPFHEGALRYYKEVGLMKGKTEKKKTKEKKKTTQKKTKQKDKMKMRKKEKIEKSNPSAPILSF